VAVARHWPDVLSNSVNPGRVPTKIGGAGAPGDLEMGHQTQTWLADSRDEKAMVSGHYWFHKQQVQPVPLANNQTFQERSIDGLVEMTS